MYLTIAFRNLRQGGKRTWILGVALMGVSGLLTLLLCLTNGLNDSIIRAAETISAGHVNVAGFWKSSPTAAGIPIVTDFETVKQDVLKISRGLTSRLTDIADGRKSSAMKVPCEQDCSE